MPYKDRRKAVENNRLHRHQLRKAVLAFLGGKCQHCGFADERALQVDHVNGGGNKERASSRWYRVYLNILSGAPGYQLLCANCNWIKKAVNGEVRRYAL